MNNATIQKIQRGREQDRQNRQKIELQPRQKLMPFRVWLRRKNPLGEAVEGNAVVDSLMMWLPNAADDNEKAASATQIAKAIIKLSAVGDVTVTAVAVAPDN